MPVVLTCTCSKKLRVEDELVGKKVRCPGCGTILLVPAKGAGVPSQANRPSTGVVAGNSRDQQPAFPFLGKAIGWTAVLVGCLMLAGGIGMTVYASRRDAVFPLAGLVIFAPPGFLWVLCGTLLLRLRHRFVMPFWGFLLVNLLVGFVFTTQARSLGGPGDAKTFAAIGLGFILGSVLFQLFHAFLVRDVRRKTMSGITRGRG